jgi:hypothetical protein
MKGENECQSSAGVGVDCERTHCHQGSCCRERSICVQWWLAGFSF